MSYQVILEPTAVRNLNRIPEKVRDSVLVFIKGPLSDNPYRVGKPLRGELAGLWSARRDTFRVVYNIDDHKITVSVVDIGHRADIYRSR